RPPGNLLHVERVRAEYPPRLRDEIVGRDIAFGDALAALELAELDIEPDEIVALARDDDNAAFVRRLDERLAADVRKIRDGQNVHHAPGMICGIAAKLAPDGGTHDAACAVAADHVTG